MKAALCLRIPELCDNRDGRVGRVAIPHSAEKVGEVRGGGEGELRLALPHQNGLQVYPHTEPNSTHRHLKQSDL